MTRGTAVDYVFLGEIPQRQWWNRLSDENLLFTNEFSLAVEGRGARWSIALFGVPSARRDEKDRPIRYTLIVEAGAEEAERAVRIVRLALDGKARAELGAGLDDIHPADLVDGVLGKQDGFRAPAPERVVGILDELAAKQPGTVPVQTATPRPWAAPAAEKDSVDAFVAYAWQLAQGADGVAISASGYETAEDAGRAVAVVGTEVAVLAADAGFSGVRSLKKVRVPEPLEVPVRPTDPTGEAPATGGPAGPIPAKALALAGFGLILVLLILWLLRKL